MASDRCRHCGAKLQPNSSLCVSCGNLVPRHKTGRTLPAQVEATGEQTDASYAAPAAPPAPQPQYPQPYQQPYPQPLAPQQQPYPQPQSPQQPYPQTQQPYPQPSAAPAPRAPEPARVELAFSTGQRAVVSGAALLGRKPADAARAMGIAAVEVFDDTKSVSRVHLHVEVVGDVVAIGDAGSANGARLAHGGYVYPLDPGGTRLAAVVGDTVWLGDLSFVIRPAAPRGA